MTRNEAGRLVLFGHSWLGWANIPLRTLGLVLVEIREFEPSGGNRHGRWYIDLARRHDARS